MKNKFILILIVITLFCLVLTAYAQIQKSVPVGQGWEYQEIQLSQTESSLPKLNALGSQGWELVGVMSACQEKYKPASSDKTIACDYWAYMKRRK